MSDKCNYAQLGVEWLKACNFTPVCVVLCCPGVGETSQIDDAIIVEHEEVAIENDRGRTVVVSYRDFVVAVDKVVINGERTKPETGWIVKWDGCEYRICKRNGLASVGWHDEFRCRYVIRTALQDGQEWIES